MISPRSLYLVAMLPLVSSCSSSEEPEPTPSVMSQRMADRFASSRRRMSDPNDRSVFDKAMQSSVTKGKGTGGWLGRKSYHSNQYSGTHAYTNAGSFKTSGYSRADDKSAMAKQGFAQSGKVSSAADDGFKTGNSAFADQSARESGQTFSGASDVFKTTANRDAKRSQEKNDRPKFIVPEENYRKPAYTEDQVRRLLGRQ